MKKIIEYVPIITVCLIYFGFCNLHYYYQEFKIDIYHYISNTEILLSFLPTIVLLASTFYIFVYSKLVNHPDLKGKDEKTHIEQNKKIESEDFKTKERKIIWRVLLNLPFQLLFLLIFKSIISYILIYYFNFKNYQLQEFNLFYALIFLSIIYISSNLFTIQKLINDNLILITVFSVIYVGMQIGTYRKLDADKIKDGLSTRKIEFEYNGKTITTSKQNIYIGQTQSYLFLYNLKDKTTSIYKTENIDSLIIK